MTTDTKTKDTIVTVFGSSRPQRGNSEYKIAFEIGKLIAQSGYIVCNGGYGGTMEASAHGAKEAGGRTIGVVAEFFGAEANPFIDRKFVMTTLMERLMKLIELGDAYVVLRGGTGTLVELAAVWEYIAKRVMKEKPVVVVGDSWLKVIEAMREELEWEEKADAIQYVTVVNSAKKCIEVLQEKLKY